MKKIILFCTILISISINSQKQRYSDGVAGDKYGLNNELLYDKEAKKMDDFFNNAANKKALNELKSKVSAKEEEQALRDGQKEEDKYQTKETLDKLIKAKEQEVIKEKNEKIRNILSCVGIVTTFVIIFYIVRVSIRIYKRKGVAKNMKVALKKYNLKTLNKEEVIVLSIVIGTLLAILFGYIFGETQYYHKNVRVYYEAVDNYYAFNYTLGIASFIICSGISFLYLSKINIKYKK